MACVPIKMVTMSVYYLVNRVDSPWMLRSEICEPPTIPYIFLSAMLKRYGIHFNGFVKILFTGICDRQMMEDVVMATLNELELLSL
jgi:hypothetical protein